MLSQVLLILTLASLTYALPTSSSTTTAPSTSTLGAPPLAPPPTQPPAFPPPPPAQHPVQPAPDNTQPSAAQQQFPNTYRFVHNDGRSMVSESRDGEGNVAGSFSFLGTDGIQRTTYYRAGPQGYEMIGGPQISGLTLVAAGRNVQSIAGANLGPSSGSAAILDQPQGSSAAILEQPQGRSAAILEQPQGRSAAILDQSQGRGAAAFEQAQGRSVANSATERGLVATGHVLQEVASLQQLIDSPQFLLNRPSNEMYTNPELFYQQKFEQLQDSLYKTNEFNIPIPKPINDSQRTA